MPSTGRSCARLEFSGDVRVRVRVRASVDGDDVSVARTPAHLGRHRDVPQLQIVRMRPCSSPHNTDGSLVFSCRASTAEATVHSFITLNTLISAVAGIVVWYLMDDDKMTAQYAVTSGLIMWSCFVANFFNLIVRVSVTAAHIVGVFACTTDVLLECCCRPVQGGQHPARTKTNMRR